VGGRREDPEKKERNEREPRAGWLAKYQKVIGGGEGNLQVFKRQLGRGSQKRRNEQRKKNLERGG